LKNYFVCIGHRGIKFYRREFMKGFAFSSEEIEKAKEKLCNTIIRQNKLGLRLNKDRIASVESGKTEKEEKSEKVKKIEALIKGSDFGCKAKSVASLMSVVIGEKVEVEDVLEDELDPEFNMIIPKYSLLKMSRRMEYYEEVHGLVSDNDLLLNVGVDNEECYKIKASEFPKLEKLPNVYMGRKGVLGYCISEINSVAFCFAEESEIRKFVSGLSKLVMQIHFNEMFS